MIWSEVIMIWSEVMTSSEGHIIIAYIRYECC